MEFKKYSVSNEDVFEAWPDVVKINETDLLCVYTECSHHRDRTDSRIVMRKSRDRGRTWGERKALTEYSDHDFHFNNNRVSKLSNGTLAIICDRVWANDKSNSPVYIWFSTDEGETWSEPVLTPVKGIVPDKLRELRSGRWIISAHAKNIQTDKYEQYVWLSDDRGKTWSDRIVAASDSRYNLCEGCVIELPDDTLVIVLRENSMCGYDCFKSISYDGGLSWSGVYHTPVIAGHRPVGGILQDGRIMITHRFLHGGPIYGTRAQNTFIALTDIDSIKETERLPQKVRIIPLDYDRASVADTGYTGWVQFNDGEIYVVNYIRDDAEKCQIRGYSFYPDELIIPCTDKYSNSL